MAVLLVPQAMAYAALAGMPPQAGLHAAIVSLIVYAALGTSRLLLMGPAALDALLVAAVVTPVARGDAERYVAAASLLAVLVGLVQIALALLRLSGLSTVLTAPAVRGFTAGAALLICATQVPELLGLDGVSTGSLLLPAVDEIVRALTGLHLQTALLGVGALLLLVLLPRALPAAPAPLIVMLLTTGLVVLLALEQQGVRVVGEVPAGPPVPVLPRWDASLVRELPQARPSFRLFTRPAWLTEDIAGSSNDVRRKTCRVLRCSGCWALQGQAGTDDSDDVCGANLISIGRWGRSGPRLDGEAGRSPLGKSSRRLVSRADSET